eukprot:67225_1
MAAEEKEGKKIQDQIFVVGSNYQDQLGVGHSNDIKQLTEWKTQDVSISTVNCGSGYTIITDQNNNIWCTGSNQHGQLVQNQYFSDNNINIKSIMTNPETSSTFFLSQKNKLYACGSNEFNQLGLNDKQIQMEKKKEQKRLQSTNLGQMISRGMCPDINQPLLINNVSNIKDAQSSSMYSILLDNNGIAYSTKYSGIYGFKGFQPIQFFHNKTITQISISDAHCLFIDSQSNIWSLGDSNSYGQLGLGHCNSVSALSNPQLIRYFADNMITINKIYAGYYHSLCLDDNGIVYAFGTNEHGQCGLPKDIKSTHTPIKIYSLSNHEIVDVKCGFYHSYCKSADHQHWLFGNNDYNQCSLSQMHKNDQMIHVPFCIDEMVNKLTNGKQIKDVYVGQRCT